MTLTIRTFYFTAQFKSSPKSATETVAIAGANFDEAHAKLTATLDEHKVVHPDSSPVIISLAMVGAIIL